LEFLTQTAGTTSVVRDRDYGRQVINPNARTILFSDAEFETGKECRESSTTANYDDIQTAIAVRQKWQTLVSSKGQHALTNGIGLGPQAASPLGVLEIIHKT